MRLQVGRLVTLAALFLGGLRGAAGCSDSAPKSEPVAAAITNGLAPNARKVGEFVGQVDHQTNTFVIKPAPGRIPLGGSVTPESVNSLTNNSFVLDDGGGSPTINTVDLVTTNTNDDPTHNKFTAKVELRSFYDRAYADVYVQITSVTYGGNPISGYDGTNSATSNPLGLDATHGLWGYSTNSGIDGGSFIDSNPNLKTTAGRWTDTETWRFANANDTNIVYGISVWAAGGFSGYTQSFKSGTYEDACSGGHSSVAASKKNISLPFDFTIYGTNVSQVNIENNGQITFGNDSGSSLLTTSGTALNLPSASAPGPSFFPFWDDLTYGTGGMMCWQTFGDAPNQTAIFEWRTLTFNSPPDVGAVLDFEVILYEGTGEIDTIYKTMTPAGGDTSGREKGNQAYVGLQDSTQTLATGEFHQSDFGAGKGYSYIPAP